MKKIIYLVLFLSICASLFAQSLYISENSYEKVSITFESGALSVNEISAGGMPFSQIFMQEYDVSNNPGAPQLPVLAKMLQIPVCDSVIATVVSAEYEEYEASSLGVNYPIFPSQPSASKSETDPPFVYNQSIYSTDDFYALPLVSVEKAGVRRGIALANVYVSPVQYNPVTHIIRVYTQIDVEFTFMNANRALTTQLQAQSSPLFELDKNMVVNKMNHNSRAEFSGAPIKYLIIANSMFAGNADLAAFVSWKRRLGYLVEVAYTNDATVGTTTTSIKNFIQNQYNNATSANPAPSFVLLVGDVEQLPAFTGETSTGHVTDLYYATLIGNDFIPDCYYGRLSATTNVQLSNQIAKIMMYEQFTMPDPSYLGNAVLVAGTDENGYSPTHADGQVNYIYNNYINPNSTTHNFTTVYKHNYNCSSQAATIRSEIDAGVGIANYTAHGGASGWSDPAFSKSHVSLMTNNGKYGLLIGNCCLTGKFNTSECFGEALLRAANKGAMGYIGASNNSYWNEDVYWAVGVRSSITADMYYNGSNLGAFDKMFHTHGESYGSWVSTIGGILQVGNMSVQSSSSSRKQYYWEIYHCFGDPSVRVYLGIPSTMTVTADSAIDAGSLSYTAQVAPYAYVALKKESVELVAAAFANANGNVTLALPETLEPGEYELVALAQNYIPYFQTVLVEEGPDVACARPIRLTCTEVTGSTASLSWNESGSATNWVVQYSLDNTFETYAEVTVSDLPTVTLTGLTEENTYYARVKADCGATDGESQWGSVCAFYPTALETAFVGSGTNTHNCLPSYSYYKYALSQQIYTPEEIGSPGSIRSIAFFNTSDAEVRIYDIYLLSTTKNSFSSNNDWIPVTDQNKVFSGAVNMASGEWTTFVLDTPFEYDGVSNLVLVADDNTGDYTSAPHMSCQVFDGVSNCAIYKYNDNTNFNPNSPGSYDGNRLSQKNQLKIEIIRSTPHVVPTYVNISGNTAVCPGHTTTLTASSDVEGSYSWSTGATGPQITVGAGSYSVTVTSTAGNTLSESVVVMENEVNHVTESQTACDSYTWLDGNTYVESTMEPTLTLTNAAGCDSVITLHLTINHSTFSDTTAVACESFIWSGTTYTESGDYTSYLTNAAGCDSIVTLHLTVNNPVTSEFTIETSDSCYVWNGQIYCKSDDYEQVLIASTGCDSVVTLHLTTSVGIEDYEWDTHVLLAPNPTKQVAHIIGLNEQLDFVEVVDLSGRMVMKTQNADLEVSSLATGVYIVKIHTTRGVLNRKLIKQ